VTRSMTGVALLVLLLGGCSKVERTDELHFTVVDASAPYRAWEIDFLSAELEDAGSAVPNSGVWPNVEVSVSMEGSEDLGDDTALRVEATCSTGGRVFRDAWSGSAGKPTAIEYVSHFTLFANGMQAVPERCAIVASFRRGDRQLRVEGCLSPSAASSAGVFEKRPCDEPVELPTGAAVPRRATASPLLAWPPDGEGKGWAVFRVDFSRDGRPDLPSDAPPVLDATCARASGWTKRIGLLTTSTLYCTDCRGWHPLAFGIDLAQHGLLKRSPPDACLLQLRPAKGAEPIHTWCWRSETGFRDGDAGCEELWEVTK